jgi:putative phage-type endonuclease
MDCDIVLPAGTDRDTWLAERRKGVTSTDAAAIAGVSPWATALDVYLDKKGLLPQKFVSKAMDWGTRLETTIAQAYADVAGEPLDVPPMLVRSREWPFLLASLDRVTRGGRKIVELKSARTAEGWGEAGTDDLPEYYIAQTQHQMATTGIHQVDVAVLIGGSDFRIYHVERNHHLIEILFGMASDFWKRVESNQPPEPDWKHPRTPELVGKMYGVAEALDVWLGHDVRDLAELYVALGREEKELKERRESVKAKLLFAMGMAGKANLPGGAVMTRKTIRNKGYTVEPFEYIRLNVKGTA